MSTLFEIQYPAYYCVFVLMKSFLKILLITHVLLSWSYITCCINAKCLKLIILCCTGFTIILILYYLLQRRSTTTNSILFLNRYKLKLFSFFFAAKHKSFYSKQNTLHIITFLNYRLKFRCTFLSIYIAYSFGII